MFKTRLKSSTEKKKLHFNWLFSNCVLVLLNNLVNLGLQNFNPLPTRWFYFFCTKAHVGGDVSDIGISSAIRQNRESAKSKFTSCLKLHCSLKNRMSLISTGLRITKEELEWHLFTTTHHCLALKAPRKLVICRFVILSYCRRYN